MAINTPDLSLNIGSLRLPNPVMTASGTFGYGKEFESFVDLGSVGAVVVKGISLLPRPGNPPPRIVETACGMLNAIGLENVGVERFVSEKLPYLRTKGCRVIVNVLGDSIEEYCQLASRLNGVEGVNGIELNISCPNVKKGGVAFGTNESMAREVTAAVRKITRLPLIVKLSPNVTDIGAMAKAVEEGGADAVSLINTLIGMAISIKTKKPVLANTIGGLSGPAIKPVALRMVFQVADRVKIPVIGIGGITTWQDAIEFILAGASAIQVGTANFINPRAVDEIRLGITNYLVQEKIGAIQELIGAAKR
ncbi:MAG: dihydroorotate dehydrogenase [Proteobacteria bacterium]|nr:dihydroorotate dehydrogenase [Desulfobulbaceae bacterium]MBU4151880.1 dihydroorotate dehydrogenase [Pseudomonadota bacterium]